MKRLMYLSVSLLCLALATLIGFHIGQGTAGADIDTSNPGQVVGLANDGINSDNALALTRSGDIWAIRPSGWVELRQSPLPVSQIKFWSGNVIVSVDDVAYGWNGTSWYQIGPYPGPTSIQPTTWSAIKAQHR
jgi:hypothetical protein